MPAEGVLFVGEDAPLASERRRARGERQLEAKDHAGRSRMSADEDDARFADRLELVLEELVVRLVRAHDANCDRWTVVLAHQ